MGSEMCIRDSSKSELYDPDWDDMRTRPMPIKTSWRQKVLVRDTFTLDRPHTFADMFIMNMDDDSHWTDMDGMPMHQFTKNRRAGFGLDHISRQLSRILWHSGALMSARKPVPCDTGG